MRLSILWRIMEIEEGVIRRGRRPRWITPSEISIILHMIRKLNSIIVYYSFKIMPSLKTRLKHAYLHRSIDVKFIFDLHLLAPVPSCKMIIWSWICLCCLFEMKREWWSPFFKSLWLQEKIISFKEKKIWMVDNVLFTYEWFVTGHNS